jgi:hypothetical protein
MIIPMVNKLILNTLQRIKKNISDAYSGASLYPNFPSIGNKFESAFYKYKSM